MGTNSFNSYIGCPYNSLHNKSLQHNSLQHNLQHCSHLLHNNSLLQHFAADTDLLYLIPTWAYFKRKIFLPYLVDSENLGHQECNFCKKLLKIWENVFSKQDLDFLNIPNLYEVLLKSKKGKITGV
jgi:hypothetical protein